MKEKKKPTLEELFSIIAKIDNYAYINFSNVTHKFYVTSQIRVKEDRHYTHVCEHRDTVDEAVRAFYEAIQGVSAKLELPTIVPIHEYSNGFELPKLI